MLDLLVNTMGSVGGLSWWHEHPILIGGDKSSPCPGMAIHYIPHSNGKTFEVRVEPVQIDQPQFTQQLLTSLLKEEFCQYVDVSVMHGEYKVGGIIIEVDSTRSYAYGDGEWYLLEQYPDDWQVEWAVH